MSFTYEYQRPMVSADIAVLKKLENQVYILLIKRLNQPYKDHWALPGGFLEMNESLLDCAHRELKEETNLSGLLLEQLYTFGDVGRDPRGRCITIVYWGWLNNLESQATAGDDAKEVQWFPIDELPVLAFDHQKVMELVKEKILEKP
jgi:8-oxo-dGTP diphosphatase